jgi:hypothetical protein
MAAPEKRVPEAPPHWLRGGSPVSIDEALRAAELWVKVAEAARAELEAQKLAGEVARQPLEDQLLEVRFQEGLAEVARRQAETKSLEDGTFRSIAYLVVFLLLVIFILVLALIDPQLLENIGQVFRWAPK